MGDKTWELVMKFHHLIGLFLVAVVAAVLYLKGDNIINWNLVKVEVLYRESKHDMIPQKDSSKKDSENKICNLFTGKWVYDNKSMALYKDKDCPVIEDNFNCGKLFRTEFKYLNWRWQPRNCDLPRFDGAALLEKIRGKKIMFVGDSLGRNTWQSMVCLVESTIPPWSKLLITRERLSTTFQEYNATIEFHWSPFLVESNHDDPFIHARSGDRILRIEAIEKHAKVWNEADIVVFDSYTWWLLPNIQFLWGSFNSSDAILRNASTRERSLEMALRTWSDWLEFNLNRTKTQLFFLSMSPVHAFGSHWGGREEQNCFGETEPLVEGKDSLKYLMNYAFMQTVETSLDELQKRTGIKVQYLNITEMTAYRKDAHPTATFRIFKTKKSSKSMRRAYIDCMHWCLPGVPDVWNQILYSYIMGISS